MLGWRVQFSSPLSWCGFVHHTDSSSDHRVWRNLVQGKAQQDLWKRGTACNREDGRIRHIWGHSSTPSAAKAPVSGAGAEGRVEGKLVCGRCVIHTGSSVSNVPLAFPLSLRISEPSQATATGFGAIWTRLPLTDPAGRFWQVWSQGLSGI